MSRLQTFTLPDVGEGLTEAEILSWHVAVGDTLTVNQIMVEIETAKAAVELPSPYAGRVHKLLAEPGVTIAVGTPILQIDTDPDAGPLAGDGPAGGAAPPSGGDPGGAAAGGVAAGAAGGQSNAGEDAGTKIGETTADGRVATLVGYIPAGGGSARRPRKAAAGQATGVASAAQPEASPAAPAPATAAPATTPAPHAATAPATGSSRAPLANPPVRKLAKDLGVDLRTVHATRSDGVISRADVEAALAGDGARDASAGVGAGTAPAASGRAIVDYDPGTREQRVPVKGVRKMTAAAVVSSAFTAPHVTEFLTVDVTPMMQLRDRLRKRREFADVRITPLTFAARAVCIAARRTPAVNATWDGDAGDIVYKQYVHLGIAAATPRGLIVPNIKDADQLDLLGLAAAIGALTETARSGKTALTAMTGGTITITNVGVFGVDTGTPIINLGESAILALGSVKDAPWVVDGVLAVRKVCQLALSFDHRVVDGQQGSEFLADVGALLADPALAMAL